MNPENATFYRLYGFPIAHSISPSFHNLIFNQLGGNNNYSLFSTSKVIPQMLEEIRSETFGGSRYAIILACLLPMLITNSVTMPIKAAIIPYLDDLSPESRATGAVNTIVKVSAPDGPKLIGTNTDILGVKNALLRRLRIQHPSLTISPQSSYSEGTGAGAVFGGGATTRSAVYALMSLGLHPIYLVNRDADEIKAVQSVFPELVRKGSLIHLDHRDKVEELLAQPHSPRILMIVGAIPAIKPITQAERMVYTVASSMLTLPYDAPAVNSSIENSLPIPIKRLFLEMAYKPRITPMLKVAMAHGWDGVDGTNAMVEQGFAQQRMWLRGDASAETGSDPEILGLDIEQKAREFVLNVGDVPVTEAEVDRAANIAAASVPVVMAETHHSRL
ncbi:hypothetical protein D9757_005595 [Collybiopsis confluens]|uniref:Shikimate dehydrogenase substrate binding N-terminal domain-containing protein n=1 Tax=Collybiopsis confluens TaxID=2823264 RepID=A0A8H5MCF7_9AGAR|nr:hypothetical protein D9757_005595 [Collybiopsis confluens]